MEATKVSHILVLNKKGKRIHINSEMGLSDMQFLKNRTLLSNSDFLFLEEGGKNEQGYKSR